MADYEDGPSEAFMDRSPVDKLGTMSPLAQLEAVSAEMNLASAEVEGGPHPLAIARPPADPDGSGGTNEPGWFPRWVSALRRARPAIAVGMHAPVEPQRALAKHGAAGDPYAPFKGLPSDWASHVYDDGGTFEGLTYAGQPHGPGVMVAGTDGGGGGLRGLGAGDRYEGEWHTGFAHGLGIGLAGTTLYKGEWALGKRHGCGLQVDLAPFYEAVAGGADPDEAWEAHAGEIEGRGRGGTWIGDALLARSAPDSDALPPRARLPGRAGKKGPPGSDQGTIALCTAGEVAATVDETEEVAARAAMFTYKPGGSVANLATQDASGLPAPVMQDPLHYPHGTKFLAPGPLGQCFAIPDSPALRAAMAASAEAAAATWEDFNLEYEIMPGSALDEARALAYEDDAKHMATFRDRMAFLARVVRIESTRAMAQVERERAGRNEGGRGGRPMDEADLVDEDLVAAAADAPPPPTPPPGGGRFGSISLAALSGGPRAPWVRRR